MNTTVRMHTQERNASEGATDECSLAKGAASVPLLSHLIPTPPGELPFPAGTRAAGLVPSG